MFKYYPLYIVCIVVAFLIGCERHNQAQFYGLGTYITAQVHSKPKHAKAFVHELEQLTQQQEKQLYAWGNGELAELNKQIAQARCFANPSVELVHLLLRSRNLNQLSNSLFEPAIAPLVELWSFHDATLIQKKIPSDSLIQEKLKKLSSISNLKVNNDEICTRTKLRIDLGAIAKGWGAQHAADLLQKHSIQNALIDFGGDLILKGKNTNKQAWAIGLRDPNSETPPANFTLSTENNILAVFTSGDYERAFRVDGKHYHHILDPRTGYPVSETHSVTVVHPDPVLADAAATALFVAGKNWQTIAKKMQIKDALLIFPDQQVEITRSLQNKTRWLNTNYKVTVINLP